MSLISTLTLSCLLCITAAEPEGCFQITVVDSETGRGVPLVELSTVNNIRYVTDSNGIVAFDEPGLMNQSVFFLVKSHGYEFPADRVFGFHGQTLDVKPGGKARLEIKRLNIAERLYRVTGAGIYRDSVLSGAVAPIRQPLLNAKVLGSDSVLTAVFREKMFWFWGDTNRPGHPLGNFHTTGATSLLPRNGGLDPARGVELTYFQDDEGFVRPMAQMPGDGPTWLDGLVVLNDGEKGERMFAAYAKVRPPLTIYARGLAEFNSDKEAFEQVAEFDVRSPVLPSGHPVIYEDEDKQKYVYFADPFPLVRAPADADALRDLTRYEAFSCLKQGSRLDLDALDKVELDRRTDGSLQWGWKRETSAVTAIAAAKLVEAGRIEPEESLVRLADADTGETVVAHRGSVYFNAYRRRWVMIAVQIGGHSMLGELWYAEADALVGPWRYARKIATHDQYSFYNPKQHPQFDQQDGRIIFFEGTYTHMFSGNTETTPRYEYNQIMYRLDLADERLRLPVAVYRRRQTDGSSRWTTQRAATDTATAASAPAFFAADRPRAGLVPVFEREIRPGRYELTLDLPAAADGGAAEPAFYSLPGDYPDPPLTTEPLFEFVSADGRQREYSLEGARRAEGLDCTGRPICRVWRVH